MELASESPAARLQAHGLKGVNNIDLLAYILSREEKDLIVNERTARGLVEKFPAHRLLDISLIDLKTASGLEELEGTRFLAAIELGRRLAGQGRQPVKEIKSAADAYDIFSYLGDEKQEHFCAVFLNTKGHVISMKTLHIGTLNMSVVSPRDLFREAVRENAASVIVAHNHPSGDTSPSPEDIQITKKLAEIGELLDITLLDHIIIGGKSHLSLQKHGYL